MLMDKKDQYLINELTQLCIATGEKFMCIIHKRPTSLDRFSISQVKVLMILSHKESFKMKDITENLGIANSSATEVIDKLIKEDLVERFRKPDDRRVVRVKLTEKGRNFIDEIKELKRKCWRSMIEKSDEEDREDLLRVAKKFYELICRAAEEGAFL
jgi:DNA-binding MarR family transcriptional regulator